MKTTPVANVKNHNPCFIEVSSLLKDIDVKFSRLKSMSSKSNKVALFIMPRSSSAWQGAEAVWITVAGWATAAEERFGEAYVITSDRAVSPSEALHFPVGGTKSVKGKLTKSRWAGWIPRFLITLIRDLQLCASTRRYTIDQFDHLWKDKSVVMIWEHHDLFSGPGKQLAKKLDAPLIKYVHAPQVWEAAKWGVKRHVWGELLEHLEMRSLNKADVVACVSDEVCNKLKRMGVVENKMIISPMAVDPKLFNSNNKVSRLTDKLGWSINKKMVIGWTGSFRSFHGLDHLVLAFKKVHERYPGTILLLVGDGFERVKMEQLVRATDLTSSVIFAGRKSFSEIPEFINLFDIAIVSARSAEGFHYSPLKLREYMVAGKPTLAPRAGEIATVFKEGEHVVFFEAGNVEDLAIGMMKLISDELLRSRLSEQGRSFVLATSTWANELEKICKALNI